MKLGSQYSVVKRITPTKGDFITEINFMRALSRHHQVFYDGQPVNFASYSLGLRDHPGRNRVKMDADFYFIRANKYVFDTFQGKKAWFATPYDKERMKKATIITTFTDAWTEKLRRGDTFPLNPDGIKWGDKVFTLHQTISPQFVPLSENVGRLMIYNDQKPKFFPIIGIFGRMTPNTYPAVVFENIDKILKMFPDALFVCSFTVEKQKILTNNRIINRSFPHDQMGHILNACDMTITGQHGEEWEFCGNMKPLESAGCGVPMIMERAWAREITFGKDYPYFVEKGTMADPSKIDNILEKIHLIIDNPPDKLAFSDHVLKHRIQLTSRYFDELLKRV